MTVNYTTLLGLAQPVTGTEAGAWGDVVNNYITSFLDASVAGTQTISGSQTAVTLSVTNGSALVTAGSGATGSAQFQIINCTGNPGGLLTITAPASSRQYIIINATSTSQSVKIVGSGPTTGVTLVSGEKAHVAWNGSDFVKIATQNGTGEFVTVDTTNLEVTNIKAKDGTAAMSIADSTGAVTISTLLNVDNLRLDGNTLSSTNTNGAINLTPNGTGQVTVTNDALINSITVGRGAGAVSTNTAVGNLSLSANTTASNNTAVGYQAGYSNIIGTDNLFAGYLAGFKSTGVKNTLIGSSAGYWVVGDNNTALGWDAGANAASSSGTYNVSVGNRAGRNTTSGSSNTALGGEALYNNTTASNNTAVGYQAGYSNTFGAGVTAVGTFALYANTTASSNTAVGYASLITNTFGAFNTAVGDSALRLNTTASNNTAVGYQAGYSNTFGIYLAAFGYRAAFSNTTGNASTAVGHGALRLNTFGDDNTAIGFVALESNSTGAQNTAVGSNALTLNTFGSRNTAVGLQALGSNTTANNNTAVGYQAGYTNVTGAGQTFIGYQAGYTATGTDNTAIGSRALYLTTTGVSNVSVGLNSLYNNTFGNFNVAVGRDALISNTTASYNTAVGYQSQYTANGAGNTNNTSIGAISLYSLTTGTLNAAVGVSAMYNNTFGSYNVAIGVQALQNNTTASNNTAVGYQAAYSNTFGGIDAFGRVAGFANTTGVGNVAIGQASLYTNTFGANNTAVGWLALNANTTASNNTAVGYQSLYVNTTGTNNTAFGHTSLFSNTTGIWNTAVGVNALNTNVTGSYNTSVGLNSLYAATNSYNTSIGYSAGSAITTGAKNVILGSYTGNQGGLDIRTASNYIVLSDGDGNPRGYFDNNGTWIVPGASGFNTAKEYNTTRWSLSTTMLENNNYQRFKVTIGTTRVSAYARIRATISPDAGIPYSQGSEIIVSMGRADGGAGATLLYAYSGSDVSINEPQTSGNDVLFGVTVRNNGTGTSPTVNIVVDYLSASPTQFTWASVSGTTAGGTSLIGLAKFNPSGTIANAVVIGANGLGLGNTTPSSGTGITFPATQSASSDANTLDDYEEGTWTITLTPETSGTIGANASFDTGAYTKVGRMVTVTGCVNVGAGVSSPVGTYVILSLPFQIADLDEFAGRFGGSVTTNIGGTLSSKPFQAIEGESAIRVIMNPSGLALNDQFYISLSYFI